MSQSGVSSLVSGDPSVGSFTVGRKQISLAKNKKQHKQQHQHHDEQQQQQQQSHSGGGDRHDGKRRPRVDLKSQRPVHVHAAALQSHGLVYPSASSGANGGGGEEDTPDGVNLSLVGATGQRRRVVEVRTKNSRDAQMSASRHQHRSETQASGQSRNGGAVRVQVSRVEKLADVLLSCSGFNTKGGHLKAMIVLPKNEEKMKAREQLMQMHPHIGQVFRGLAPPEVFQQEPFNRILTEHAACMPYRRRNKEAKTVIVSGEGAHRCRCWIAMAHIVIRCCLSHSHSNGVSAS
jgi:hypothetical protein